MLHKFVLSIYTNDFPDHEPEHFKEWLKHAVAGWMIDGDNPLCDIELTDVAWLDVFDEEKKDV